MPSYEFHSLVTRSFRIATYSANLVDDHAAGLMARGILSAGGIAEIWTGSRRAATIFQPCPPAAGTPTQQSFRPATNREVRLSAEPVRDTIGALSL